MVRRLSTMFVEMPYGTPYKVGGRQIAISARMDEATKARTVLAALASLRAIPSHGFRSGFVDRRASP